MKTTLDIVDIVWQHLNSSSLKTSVNGVICKKRPAGSIKEDVVINATFADNEQVQSSLVNVNIYAPNKPQKFNGQDDFSQPDFVRLKALADMAVPILDKIYINDYWLLVQQVVGPIEDIGNQHYVNIRIDFHSENF
jgi:hypothetical protein